MPTYRYKTREGLLGGIKSADAVYIQGRFGTSERWIKISKAEARALVSAMGDRTPEELEFADGFGELNSNLELFLG